MSGHVAQASEVLAINIPIYKRPELLLQCLLRTISAIEKYRIGINLFDDSVDESNDVVVRHLKSRYPLINHMKNKKNLGIDRNIDQAARFGTTDYIWLLGEDDYVLDGALELIFPVVSAGSAAVIAVNYSYATNDLKTFSKQSVMGARRSETLSSAKLLAQFGWAMGFIGACIVKRSVFSQVSAEKYFGTFFAHLGCIFEGAFGQECAVLCRPAVANRAEDITSTSWSADALNVYFGMEKLLLMLTPPYSKETIEHALLSAKPALPHRTFRGLLALRANGLLTQKECKMIDFVDHRVLQIFAITCTVLPEGLFASLKTIKRSIQALLRKRSGGR